MKKYCIGSMIICFMSINILYAETIKPEISKVIVYHDSAMIKKEAKVILNKAVNEIVITNLPAAMVDESVQVIVKDAVLQDVRLETTYLQKGDAKRINTVLEKLNAIKDDITGKQNEIASINSVLEYIKKGSTSPFSIKMTAAEMNSILQLIEQYSNQSYIKIAKLQQALQKLNQEKERLEKELALLKANEASKTLKLTVYNTGNNNATVLLQYITGNAGWDMEYDMRTDTEKSTTDITCNALVAQNTGEDWNNVAVELSTAKPFVATQLPQLNPWYLDIYRPVYYKESAKSMAVQDEDALSRAPSPEEMPEIQQEAIAISFLVKGHKTIPSDGNRYKLAIASSVTGCTLRYTTIPKILAYIMLEGEFVNPFDFPLQSGSVTVYLDGKYVNSFSLNKIYVPKETVTIGLGVDESIAVERKLVSKKTEYKGIVNKTKRIEYVYSITLNNGKKRDITVTVQDTIPVSQNEKIEVILVNKDTIGATIDNQGKVTWNVVLGSNQKKELKVHFTVEYPDNVQITGLE